MYIYSDMGDPLKPHVPSVLPPVTVHTVSVFLVNDITVCIVLHVKVKSSPAVAFSDDVDSV